MSLTFRPWRSLLVCALTCLLALLWALGSARAAQPDDLYGATVGLSDSSEKALNAAFDSALTQVLIKVTGRVDEGPALRRQVFPSSRKVLQQYRRLPQDRIYAAFDPAAIRRALDAAGQPVWGENRPLVSVWLAIDAGSGQRYILSDGSKDSGGRLGTLRQSLLGAASGRGLPVVLPLLDATDLKQVSFADVWGGFQGPVGVAAQRYRGDALLIGRSTSMAPNERNVRWTLAYGGQESNWQGSVASGPDKAADLLARQYATTASSEGRLRLLVSGIDSIAAYSQLRKYLLDMDMINSAAIVQVQSDQIELDLSVRGDADRLSRVLRSSRVLSAAEAQAGLAANVSDLHYRWTGTP